MKNEAAEPTLPTTLTGFMALMDADGDLPLGVIQALLDEVAALTAENARLTLADSILRRITTGNVRIQAGIHGPVACVGWADVDITDDELAFLRALGEVHD